MARYTYTCLSCGRRETVYPILNMGDGYNDLAMLGWNIETGECDLCQADDARADEAARERDAMKRAVREVETPMGEEMGG
jgi:hypothetical protein